MAVNSEIARKSMDPGRSFDPFADNYLGDPYAFYGPLREQAPVFYSENLGYWIVTRYDDVKECFRDQSRFSAAITLNQLKPLSQQAITAIVEGGAVPGLALVNEDPPVHSERRRRLMPAFTPQKIKALESRIREYCKAYVDRFVTRGYADLVADFTWEIPALVIFNFTGVPNEEVEICKSYATSYALFNWGFPSDEDQLRLSARLAEYWRYAKMHVERLRKNLGEDFISEMIRGQLEDPKLFDDNYLVWMMMNFTFAGHETTTAASANMFRSLLENRSQWDEICADSSLIPNAVEECLRYASSVIAWRRLTKAPVDIGGVSVPADAKLLILSGSANHDERHFVSGDELDIHRKTASQHVSFGFGAHLCMGAPLARLEMKIMLEEVSRRLPHMRLVAGQSFVFSANTSFRGPKKVLVSWDPTLNPIPEDRRI